MQLTINGLQREVPDGITVAELLELEQEPVGHVLVEVNGLHVPLEAYGTHVPEEGDRIEIILPAFGG